MLGLTNHVGYDVIEFSDNHNNGCHFKVTKRGVRLKKPLFVEEDSNYPFLVESLPKNATLVVIPYKLWKEMVKVEPDLSMFMPVQNKMVILPLTGWLSEKDKEILCDPVFRSAFKY